MKKLPPYGKPLYELQQQGFKPSNSINVCMGGRAWEQASRTSISAPNRTLALPPWASPLSFIWPVARCDVLIHDSGFADDRYIEDLVCCLYDANAEIVRYLSPMDLKLTVFHKE